MDKFTNNYGKMIFNINYVTWLISCLVLGANIRNKQNVHGVTLIKGQKIEQGQSYKYIATIINEKLNFDENCKSVCKKGHQHLYCLRKLARFHIEQFELCFIVLLLSPFYLLFGAMVRSDLCYREKLTESDSEMIQSSDR